MNLRILVVSGAIISSVGTALMVAFVTVLLVFPVQKECGGEEKCQFISKAPQPFSQLVQQSFLAISLLTIAAGVLMIRIGQWWELKKTEKSKT